MKNSFVLRIWQDQTMNPVLSYLNNITISDITLVSKDQKFGGLCLHKGNQKKFGYTMELSKQFNNVSGSHSTPNLSFKGQYIDVIVKNFPRYPSFGQDYNAARNCMNGWGYTNYLNDGFPHQLKYRKIEFLTLNP